MELEPVIGLECHIQLKTRTKMFCGCSNRGEYEPPNKTICPICTGHPGTLPVINRAAVASAARMALALGCTINEHLKWDRKNYFYPDLPKGYQISQYDLPIGIHGALEIPGADGATTIRINRLHLEEDAAKNTHSRDRNWTLVDYNRAGTPLMEIVTEADFHSPQQAKRYLQELQMIARYLDVSDADMEKGHLRCDANISLRPVGETRFWHKTEVKNINSFKHVERALEYEIIRQTKLWQTNTPPSTNTTRGWNEAKQVTVEQRWKEGEGDYRYFPEPDLPPVHAGPGQAIDPEALRATLPELPAARRHRFIEQLGVNPTDVLTLTGDPTIATFCENAISEMEQWIADTTEDDADREALTKKAGKTVSSWIASKLLGILNDRGTAFADAKVTPENFAELLQLFLARRVNSTIAMQILTQMVVIGGEPHILLAEMGTSQVSDGATLTDAVTAAIAAHPGPVADYRAGKKNAIQFLLGQVMRETKGTADPAVARQLLEERLQ
ncbi:MAG: Asp-tRNA(Asn)/Glu-tRNA(Gln) amidotransferase subunit GatB [bacterium]|nr:Asp-tRNA(Asn)/Glu-tRNA(Gln) amidotransferase subunit GatB [bacterium]